MDDGGAQRARAAGLPNKRAPASRADPAVEAAALACEGRGQRDQAVTILMAAYGPAIIAFALRMLRDREAARDVCQQVFLSAAEGIGKFEGRSSLWSWLCGIAFHRSLDQLKRLRRAGLRDDADALDLLDGQPDPASDLDALAKQRALQRCLGELSGSMRAQVLMRYVLGLSYVEIAHEIGEPHGTVQVRLSRILPRLRRCLNLEGVGR